MSKKYEESGVSLQAGYESVERIKKHVARTKNLGMMSAIGGFGGAFDLSSYNFKNPVLVSGTDGVGTKLKLAFELDIHNTIGIDVVAMCANDILAQGAIPLFFLDYLAVGKNYPEQVEAIVEGVAEGCVQADCAIVGGETAEMAGFYEDGEYDIAGFCVGAQEKELLLSTENTKAGQVVIGLPSSGVHSNGFSLVRKILKDNNIGLNEEFNGSTVGKILLTPTKIYVKEVLKVLEEVKVAGIAHITGGGFHENLPRALKDGLGMKIDKNSYEVPAVFKYLQEKGKIDEEEMYHIFNMGVGMALIVNKEDVDKTLSLIDNAFVIGEVTDESGIKNSMKKVAIFASGTGSNFEKIADDERLKDKISIELLVCDRKDAAVIRKAHDRNIKVFIFSAKDFESKEAYESVIFEEVKDLDYIFLAGYMRIISPYFLEKYKKTILNLHPSLLPKFKGKDAIEQAFNAGEKEIGISIHYVNEELDGGEVIAQRSFEVSDEDTLETVTEKVHKLEHKLYPEVILNLVEEAL